MVKKTPGAGGENPGKVEQPVDNGRNLVRVDFGEPIDMATVTVLTERSAVSSIVRRGPWLGSSSAYESIPNIEIDLSPYLGTYEELMHNAPWASPIEEEYINQDRCSTCIVYDLEDPLQAVSYRIVCDFITTATSREPFLKGTWTDENGSGETVRAVMHLWVRPEWVAGLEDYQRDPDFSNYIGCPARVYGGGDSMDVAANQNRLALGKKVKP